MGRKLLVLGPDSPKRETGHCTNDTGHALTAPTSIFVLSNIKKAGQSSRSRANSPYWELLQTSTVLRRAKLRASRLTEEMVKAPWQLIGAIILVSTLATLSFGSATNVYITPDGNAQGACTASPHNPAWFNSAANWGGGSNQIGPGTTVHLCGTFTGNTNQSMLAAQSNGTSGNPVTIFFESGTNLTSPAWTGAGAIDLDNRSHFVVDGGTSCGFINGAVTSCNGTIQNTANGTNLANQNVNSLAISANGATDIEIRNLLVANMYVHGSSQDDLTGPPGPGCVHFNGSGGSINIHNNIMHDAAWCLNGGGVQSGTTTGFSFANNEIYNFDHGVGMGIVSNGTVMYKNITFHDNHIHDTAIWDTFNSNFHHDGIHLFSYCGDGTSWCANATMTNINIYNNLCDGDWGKDNTGCIFFEGNENGANVFNNVNIGCCGRSMNNGFFNAYGININIFNNTIIGSGSGQVSYLVNPQGPNVVVKNNVITDGVQLTGQNNEYPGGQPSYVWSNNAYMNGGSNAWVFCHMGGGCDFLNFTKSSFNTWEGWTSESGGVYVNGAEKLDSQGRPQSGSAVIAAAVNLSNLCSKNGGTFPDALCNDRDGNSRPSNGSWDIGAYVFGNNGSKPDPPSGLAADVH